MEQMCLGQAVVPLQKTIMILPVYEASVLFKSLEFIGASPEAPTRKNIELFPRQISGYCAASPMKLENSLIKMGTSLNTSWWDDLKTLP